MPWGLIAVAVCSWVVYRRAAEANQAPVTWVLILWLSLFAGAAGGMVAGMVAKEAGADEVAIPVGGVCGMLVATVLVMRAAGTPTQPTSGPPKT